MPSREVVEVATKAFTIYLSDTEPPKTLIQPHDCPALTNPVVAAKVYGDVVDHFAKLWDDVADLAGERHMPDDRGDENAPPY